MKTETTDTKGVPLTDDVIEQNIIGKLYEDRVIGSFFRLPLTKDRDARFLIVALDYAMKEVERLNKVLKKEL